MATAAAEARAAAAAAAAVPDAAAAAATQPPNPEPLRTAPRVNFRCFGVFALYCARNRQLPIDFNVFRTLAAPRQEVQKKKMVLRPNIFLT